jgi:holliday junction DNA helicase RuvB
MLASVPAPFQFQPRKSGSASKSDSAERLVSAGPVDDDSQFELKLRPKRLAEFIGQSKAKEQLAIALEAAKSRG